jgi:hypothetical protein
MERRGVIVWIAIAVVLACLLLLYLLILRYLNYTTCCDFSSTRTFRHSLLASMPILLIGNTKKHSSERFASFKRSNPKRDAKSKNTKIAIFTGRGANKNHAIFEILDAKGPLPISVLQKLLNKQKGIEVTYYASLNKRIHALEKGGYVAQVCIAAPSQKGFKATLYEVRAKFYLASFLNGNNREEILSKLTDTHAILILSELIDATVPTKGN